MNISNFVTTQAILEAKLTFNTLTLSGTLQLLQFVLRLRHFFAKPVKLMPKIDSASKRIR